MSNLKNIDNFPVNALRKLGNSISDALEKNRRSSKDYVDKIHLLIAQRIAVVEFREPTKSDMGKNIIFCSEGIIYTAKMFKDEFYKFVFNPTYCENYRKNAKYFDKILMEKSEASLPIPVKLTCHLHSDFFTHLLNKNTEPCKTRQDFELGHDNCSFYRQSDYRADVKDKKFGYFGGPNECITNDIDRLEILVKSYANVFKKDVDFLKDKILNELLLIKSMIFAFVIAVPVSLKLFLG